MTSYTKTLEQRITIYENGTSYSTYFVSGSGDGHVHSHPASIYSQAFWDACHDSTIGNSSSTTFTTATPGSSYTTAGWNGFIISRMFLPFDTSSLGSNSNIVEAYIQFYLNYTLDTDNDGYDYIDLFQTTQANIDSLVLEDYDQIGSVAGSLVPFDLSLGSGTRKLYMNNTALDWISKTSYTKLGIREGHDINDHIVDNLKGASGNIVTSEGTEEEKRPRLYVTYVVSGPVSAVKAPYLKTLSESISISSSLVKKLSRTRWETIYAYDKHNHQSKVLEERITIYEPGYLTTTEFTSGSGDGHVLKTYAGEYNVTNWLSCRNATTGSGYSVGGTTAIAQNNSYLSSTNKNLGIYRVFVPFDTSTIGNDKKIVSVYMRLYVSPSIGDNDGFGYVTVIQTSQANSTTLVTADYDNVGLVDGVDYRLYLSGLGSAYRYFYLNRNALDWVVRDNYTKLGLRMGHDLENHMILYLRNNYAQIRTSEWADDAYRPKLFVTYATSGAVLAIKTAYKSLSESVTISSTTTKLTDKVKSQTITITPSIIKDTHTSKSQSISITASKISKPIKVRSDSITISSSTTRLVKKVLQESVSINTGENEKFGRTLIENIVCTPVLYRNMNTYVLLESVTITDNNSIDTHKTLTDMYDISNHSIDDFEALGTWIKAFDTTAISINTNKTFIKKDSGSVKVTTNYEGTTGYGTIQNNNYHGNWAQWDVDSSSTIGFWVWIPDATKMSQIEFKFGTVTGGASQVCYYETWGTLQNGWNYLSCKISNMHISGSYIPDYTDIPSLRFVDKYASGNTGSYTVYYDDLTITSSNGGVYKLIDKVNSNSITISESKTNSTERSISDTITLSDIGYKLSVKPLVESLNISDNYIIDTHNVLYEDMEVGDLLYKSIVKYVLSETITINDDISPRGMLLEWFAVSDSVIKGTSKLNETIVSINETAYKNISKTCSETISITDVQTKIFTDSLVLTENISTSDVLQRNINKPLTQEIIIYDGGTRINFKILYESIIVSDNETKNTVYGLEESIIITPVVSYDASYKKILIQQIGVSDTKCKGINKLKTNTVTISDSVLKATDIGLSDITTVIDDLTRTYGRYITLTENITCSGIKNIDTNKVCSEIITMAVTTGASKYQFVRDTITLTDVVTSDLYDFDSDEFGIVVENEEPIEVGVIIT